MRGRPEQPEGGGSPQQGSARGFLGLHRQGSESVMRRGNFEEELERE